MMKRCLLPLLIALWSLIALVSAEEQCSSDDGSCSNKPLKIVVIGASDGTTGGLFVEKALRAGHQVTAIARTPSKITQTHENLTVAQGNVKSPETLVEPMKGADVVVGAFGHRAFSDTFKATTLYSNGARAILNAMKRAGVKRFIMISSTGTAYVPGAAFFWDFIFRVCICCIPMFCATLYHLHMLSPLHCSHSCGDSMLTCRKWSCSLAKRTTFRGPS